MIGSFRERPGEDSLTFVRAMAAQNVVRLLVLQCQLISYLAVWDARHGRRKTSTEFGLGGYQQIAHSRLDSNPKLMSKKSNSS